MTGPDEGGPLKEWRALVEVTNVYEIWLTDDEGVGVEVLVGQLNDNGEGHEYLGEYLGDRNSPIGGDLQVLLPDTWDSGTRAGPWPCCPFPGCAVPSPPYYGLATADWFCYRHSIRGCSRMHLPEKTEWP